MKEGLPYCTTKEAIKGYDESPIAKGETNDCVVRAFASSFEVSYDYAHKYVRENFGRINRQGTYGTVHKMRQIAEDRRQINYKKVKCLGTKTSDYGQYSLKYQVKTKDGVVKRDMTVGTFAKQNPVGTFFILVSRHAFTIKDGVVIGNWEDSQKKKRVVKFAFEVK
jgi:hypothetical protein